MKKYSLEERCINGKIPSKGVIIDESSGSSGEPTNWVRGKKEQETLKTLIQHTYQLTFKGQSLFIINCFALGPWATGMNVSMAVKDVGILKSLGPDKLKLENTLKSFGKKYRYLLMGYPPFMKDFVDNSTLNLKEYDLHLVVGGEGISEGLRDYLLNYFQSVKSSYGASDLEINIAAETDLTLALRKKCFEDKELCHTLFGKDQPPMIFQYNPLDYLIEESPDKEVIISVLRRSSIAPKIRYNIKDQGGTCTYKNLKKIIKNDNFFKGLHLAFPLFYIYGRTDLTVAFYGANILTSDLDRIINEHEKLNKSYHSFQMKVEADEKFNQVLNINLEFKQSPQYKLSSEELSKILFTELKRVNQDFREVSKMFSEDKILVNNFDFQTGPFANRDIRIKNQYLS